ncbi:hypothetical protein RB195_015821 [Necator americanus]|uniref:Uncharacterized protein n=1 Tax=Necator americanus TaxID=51031 RepID=A0ABR1E8Z8_NECAM
MGKKPLLTPFTAEVSAGPVSMPTASSALSAAGRSTGRNVDATKTSTKKIEGSAGYRKTIQIHISLNWWVKIPSTTRCANNAYQSAWDSPCV